ncbi:hypothetical protein ACOB7R_003831 [Enterobacter hormaechei]|uniref:hypothetical protein n=1 Tax=Enterobacter hormaechei TaxID=158836 RepID=UPI00227A6E3E|nr:hypothetical protein [Enterobacter hormaechei]MCY3493550.1 hypothetical protein [Enterobacter hormaechei]
MFDADAITKRLNQCLDLLFLKQPLRTVFGMLVGFIIFVLVYSFRLAIAQSLFEVDRVHYTACFVIGLLVVHIRTIIDAFQGTAVDEEINSLIGVVMKQPHLSDPQKNMMIAEILQKEIAAISQKRLNKVSQEITEKKTTD